MHREGALENVSVGHMGMDLFVDNLKPLPPTGEITEQQLSLYSFVLSQICLKEQLSSSVHDQARHVRRAGSGVVNVRSAAKAASS